MHYTGGYATYTTVANADVNLVTLPEAISFPDAASPGCRLITSYHGIVDQVAVKDGERVAVFACGGVGLGALCSEMGRERAVNALSNWPIGCEPGRLS